MSKVFIEDEHKNILANANEEPFIIDQVGTDVFVNGQRQDRLDFTSNPQEQLNAKQDKLSQAQLQAIGEVDAVKSIALDNQTNKASKAEVNSLSMCPSSSYIDNIFNLTLSPKSEQTYMATGNGYFTYNAPDTARDSIATWIFKDSNHVTPLIFGTNCYTGELVYGNIPVAKGQYVKLKNTSNRAITLYSARFTYAKEV